MNQLDLFDILEHCTKLQQNTYSFQVYMEHSPRNYILGHKINLNVFQKKGTVYVFLWDQLQTYSEDEFQKFLNIWKFNEVLLNNLQVKESNYKKLENIFK